MKACSICRHEQNEAINLALLQGTPLREIAGRYGVTSSSLQRHKAHIPKQLAKAKEAKEVASASNVMQRITELDSRADSIYTQATEQDDPALALKALKELREITSLYAKLTGEIQAQTIQHIHITPEWLLLRANMLRALEPYPEARSALVKALGDGNV